MITLEEVRARFARGQGLPFADALTERSIRDALDEHNIQYRDRLPRRRVPDHCPPRRGWPGALLAQHRQLL